jgi:hypothetical protein
MNLKLKKEVEKEVDPIKETKVFEPIIEVDQKSKISVIPKPVTVINGPVGEVINFIETLPENYIVTNIIKAPSTLRKNGPIVSLAFVEKSLDYKTVIVHSEDFNVAAKEANTEIEKGAVVIHAFSSPVSSRKRGRVAFEIIIILKKKK